jgi:hypothetical protein
VDDKIQYAIFHRCEHVMSIKMLEQQIKNECGEINMAILARNFALQTSSMILKVVLSY